MKSRIILLCLLVLTILCGCQKVPDEADCETTIATIQPTCSPDAVEYRLPKNAQWILGIDSYEELSAHLDAHDSHLPNLNQKFGRAHLDGDFLLLQANESQKQAVIDAATRLLPQFREMYNSVSPDNYVEWSDDFSTLTYGLDYTVIMDTEHTGETIWDLSTAVWINLVVHCNRILLTDDCDTPIVITHKNPKTGYLLDSVLYPYEGISITSNDWKKSATEDVLIHEGSENKIYMKMACHEIGSDQIVFAPLEKDSCFSGNELLALHRFNDDGKELYTFWHFEPGSVFYILVDGTYEDGSNGRDIPFINSYGIIPERYFSLKG